MTGVMLNIFLKKTTVAVSYSLLIVMSFSYFQYNLHISIRLVRFGDTLDGNTYRNPSGTFIISKFRQPCAVHLNAAVDDIHQHQHYMYL